MRIEILLLANITTMGSITAPAGLSKKFLGMGAGAHGIGKISSVLTKIGKFDIVFMYDVSIARLIPIIKLTVVYYEKRERERSKCDCILLFCEIVNM